MKSQSIQTHGIRSGQWIALALCGAVLVAGAFEQFIPNRPDYARTFAPFWIPFAASIIAAAGFIPLNDQPRWFRIQRGLRWGGLLLMVWTANGLPFDLLRLTPLIPLDVDWPGLATRALALAAVVVLARLAFAQPATLSARPATWYGYAAFVLALPYPVLRTCWAFGGTIGLMKPGAGGVGFAPLLLTIPWLLAAVMSLFLVSTPKWIPRRLLLTSGWSATAIVAMIGPAACWSIVNMLMGNTENGPRNIAFWVFCLFYGSWFLWAIAAGAATRSYQLRSASIPDVHNDLTCNGENRVKLKVTAFIGSARKQHTYKAAEGLCLKLQSLGDVEYELVQLSDYNLKTCRGCKLCTDKGEELCPLNDDRDKLIEKIRNSDGIIFASPNYSFNVSGMMKVFLDRFNPYFHRPEFFGKAFTSIVAQGFYGGGKINKYFSFIGNGLCFNVVNGCCITTLEPMTEKVVRKNEMIIEKQTEKFYLTLTKKAYPAPTLAKLMIFRMARTSIKLMLDESWRDYAYYKNNGWFKSEYYYAIPLNPFKKLTGIFFDFLFTRIYEKHNPKAMKSCLN